ncbi:MAG: ankyrin repeat domain-containing protein [Sulfurimonas sp.]|nr:ankyrin repeat domain-containing protein [Sulfurimonas sp.]
MFTAPLVGLGYLIVLLIFSFILSYAIPFVTAMLNKSKEEARVRAEENQRIKNREVRNKAIYQAKDLFTITDLEELKKYEKYNPEVSSQEMLNGINLENKEFIDYLFTKNIKINDLNENGDTILHKAAKGNNLAAMEFFLLKGAKVEKENKNKETPLIFAAINLQKDAVEFLINKAAKFDIKEPKHIENLTKTLFTNQYKDLYAAVNNEDLKAITFFLNNGADINGCNESGQTSLIIAAGNTSLECFTYLYEYTSNTDIEIRDNNGLTALLNASRHGSKNIIEFLLSKGADSKVIDNDENNLLHHASVSANSDTVEFVLNQDLDIEACNKSQQTALFISSAPRETTQKRTKIGKEHTTNLLLKYGAKLDITNEKFVKYVTETIFSRSYTDILDAVKGHNLEAVKLFLSHGADDNILDVEGRTLLHLSATYFYKDLVTFFLDRGQTFDIDNTQDMKNISQALFRGSYEDIIEASRHNDIEAVDFFLSHGADIEASNNRGFTALTIAAANDWKEIVEFLLEKGAGIDTNSKVAVENIIKVLFGVKVSNIVKASENGHKEIVEFLLEKGASLEATDDRDNTALMMAVSRGHRNIVEFLLEKGASLEGSCKDDETLLIKALKAQNTSLIELLLTKKQI